MADLSGIVAEHYNNLEERGLEERNKSRILYMRGFNNWIKSLLIAEYLQKSKEKMRPQDIKVLDIGCGKGGDLLKWKKGDIGYIVCADVANTSVEQCEKRFHDMWQRNRFYERREHRFGAEFITADCTKTQLKTLYKNPNIQFDLVSCQFAFHYCFESIQQVDQMLQNASECLRPGGYFIGTTPDAYEIMKRLKETDGASYGNEVYRVTFQDKKNVGLFGAQYDFHLEDVVDCPEFLVYFPVLVEMAKRHNLKLVKKTRFDDYYLECLNNSDSRRKDDARMLLGKMQALETYPPFSETQLCGNKDDYKNAEEELRNISNSEDSRETRRLGTLSLAEWEAITLYLAFTFEKVSSNEDATPERSTDESLLDAAKIQDGIGGV